MNGGWGFVSFNNIEGLKDRVENAVRQARLVGHEKSELAGVDPIVDIVGPQLDKDPRSLTLAQKKDLMDQYNGIMWEVEGIQTTLIGYGDGPQTGSLRQFGRQLHRAAEIDVSLRLSATARDGAEVQQAGVSLGSNGNFSVVEGLHQQSRDIAEKAVSLLSAPKVRGGEYTVILDPVLAGVFTHEAFGHLSESDHVYENDRLKEVMVLGRQFGGEHLNIVDGAAVPGLRGSYKYDDEGVPATRSYLIKEGELVGRLHSRETAGKMGEPLSGNARAIDFRFEPIVRMTNTFIEPGSTTFEEMISDVKEGVYACDWYGGMTSMEMFTFSAREAYMIRDGKVAELLRPVTLSGNVFETLKNLDAVGNDLDMNQGGGCGKGGQSPLPVSNGSPHIRIAKCLVGGA